jgi:hypothetical protein
MVGGHDKISWFIGKGRRPVSVSLRHPQGTAAGVHYGNNYSAQVPIRFGI